MRQVRLRCCLLRPDAATPEGANQKEQAYCEQTRGGFSHRVMELYLVKSGASASDPCLLAARCRVTHAVHLDAGSVAGLPSSEEFARGISVGNGSPSAQTAPSSKCSFFQMGTVRLSVSISQRQASNAAARWAAATAINTLVSPISSRPSRCTNATSRT